MIKLHPLFVNMLSLNRYITHQIITLRMAPTSIPAERSLTYIFTTFADVACHASLTCWRPVSRLSEMSSLSLICSSLSLTPTARSRNSSHFHVGPTRQLHLLPLAPKLLPAARTPVKPQLRPLTPRRQPTATATAAAANQFTGAPPSRTERHASTTSLTAARAGS